MTTRHAALLALVALALGVALGAAQAPASPLYGTGSDLCERWLYVADRIPQRDPLILQRADSDRSWVLGFLSGVGYTGARGMKSTTTPEMLRFMTEHCRARPHDTIGQAAGALVTSLER